MKKLSDKEKQFILQLLKSCEYHQLSEKQSIGCINEILNRSISRRTYYSYKRRIYSNDIFSKLKESIYNSPLDKSAILLLNDDTDFEVRAKANKLIAYQFPSKNLSPLQSPCIDENKEIKNDKVNDAFVKINQFEEMRVH